MTQGKRGEVRIPFSKPFLTGSELSAVGEAVSSRAIAGVGPFTARVERLLETKFALPRAILTHSGTAALEMAMLLAEIGPGDEVLLPSFTFSSTANAIVLRGARPVFVDVREDTLNIDEAHLEGALTPRTKAVMVVHYAGVACEMDTITEIAKRRGLLVVEDAAQAVGASYRGRALGSIGDIAAYSFHETKNIVAGEGGALCVNRPDHIDRAEILRDKGTNRRQFCDGQVDKYTWVDVGSSFAPSELQAAFLLAQLEALDAITAQRRQVYARYAEELNELERRGCVRLPRIPEGCEGNAHIFYLLLPSEARRDALIAALKAQGISATFHFVPLHSSPMGRKLGYQAEDLPVTERVAACLIRLPLYGDLAVEQQMQVIEAVRAFCHEH